MKFFTKMLATLLLLSLMTGCNYLGHHATTAATDNYQLMQEGSEYYITLANNTDKNERKIFYNMNAFGLVYIMSGYSAPDAVEFTSLEEMVNDIVNGDFTEEELRNICMFHTDEAGRIMVCNLNTLYEPTFPETYVGFRIFWWGERYTFSIHNADSTQTVHFVEVAQEPWEDYIGILQNYEQELSSLSRVKYLVAEYDSQNNMYIYRYSSRDDAIINWMECCYSFESEENTYYVLEKYDLEISDTVPTLVSVYGMSQNRYFYASIQEPKERPCIEWISQFGLNEYIP